MMMMEDCFLHVEQWFRTEDIEEIEALFSSSSKIARMTLPIWWCRHHLSFLKQLAIYRYLGK
jgi:hypothetical protein